MLKPHVATRLKSDVFDSQLYYKNNAIIISPSYILPNQRITLKTSQNVSKASFNWDKICFDKLSMNSNPSQVWFACQVI